MTSLSCVSLRDDMVTWVQCNLILGLAPLLHTHMEEVASDYVPNPAFIYSGI